MSFCPRSPRSRRSRWTFLGFFSWKLFRTGKHQLPASNLQTEARSDASIMFWLAFVVVYLCRKKQLSWDSGWDPPKVNPKKVPKRAEPHRVYYLEMLDKGLNFLNPLKKECAKISENFYKPPKIPYIQGQISPGRKNFFQLFFSHNLNFICKIHLLLYKHIQKVPFSAFKSFIFKPC